MMNSSIHSHNPPAHTNGQHLEQSDQSHTKKGVNGMPESKFALTTFDNPYNPFTQFASWFMFDTEKGYNSCAYVGRIAKTSYELTDEENDEEVERAIDEIVRYDFMNLYKKVRNQAKIEA